MKSIKYEHSVRRMKSTNNEIQVLDSFITERYNESTRQWVPRWKEEFTYLPDGCIEQVIYGSWVKPSGNGEKFRETYSYDSNKNLIEAIGMKWDTISMDWVNDHKYEFLYDDNENLIEKAAYFWNKTDNVWNNDFKNNYSFNESGNLSQEIYIVWNKSDNDWVNYNKCIYFYEEEILTHYIRFQWNESTEKWDTAYRNEIFWDDNGCEIEGKVYKWDTLSSDWSILSNYYTPRNDDGNIIQYLNYGWNSSSTEWINNYKYDYTYDSQGDLILFISYYWDPGENQWKHYDRSTYHYSEQNITGFLRNNLQVNVYPNPSYQFISVEVAGTTNPLYFELFDLQGKEILSVKFIERIDIDVRHLKTGIYVYRVIYNNQIITGEIINVE
ncbi:MAG: DUF3836 domain-containing protein [Bacteroidales bacterium]|nr:DUF3836 domain-containing protein [Bacteroidales bacterium]